MQLTEKQKTQATALLFSLRWQLEGLFTAPLDSAQQSNFIPAARALALELETTLGLDTGIEI